LKIQLFEFSIQIQRRFIPLIIHWLTSDRYWSGEWRRWVVLLFYLSGCGAALLAQSTKRSVT